MIKIHVYSSPTATLTFNWICIICTGDICSLPWHKNSNFDSSKHCSSCSSVECLSFVTSLIWLTSSVDCLSPNSVSPRWKLPYLLALVCTCVVELSVGLSTASIVGGGDDEVELLRFDAEWLTWNSMRRFRWNVFDAARSLSFAIVCVSATGDKRSVSSMLSIGCSSCCCGLRPPVMMLANVCTLAGPSSGVPASLVGDLGFGSIGSVISIGVLSLAVIRLDDGKRTWGSSLSLFSSSESPLSYSGTRFSRLFVVFN